ncbi:MAG: UDP-N-acetylglucosamine--N-acetylmuramyl-(pentapeptide) pyrophosphoryl-undecaprenol N-acetylglucosamine transferase, partial [Longimicrobiales bacterium]
HLAFPEAVERLPSGARDRTRVTGNPVRVPDTGAAGRGAVLGRAEAAGVRDSRAGAKRAPPRGRSGAREALGLGTEGPVVLVVGGSQGSAALNAAVVEGVLAVEAGRLQRPRGLQLLWSTGPTHLATVRNRLAGYGSEWIRTFGFIDDMPVALAASDLAVSRAGAMATSEFLAWGLPAILIPLPTAAADHQTRNAIALEEAGAAIHLPEETLTGKVLLDRIAAVVEEPDRLESMGRSARERGRPRASEEIAGAIASLLDGGGVS